MKLTIKYIKELIKEEYKKQLVGEITGIDTVDPESLGDTDRDVARYWIEEVGPAAAKSLWDMIVGEVSTGLGMGAGAGSLKICPGHHWQHRHQQVLVPQQVLVLQRLLAPQKVLACQKHYPARKVNHR